MPYRKPHFSPLGLEDRSLQAAVFFGSALALVVLLPLILPWLILGAIGWTVLWLRRRQQQQEQVLHQLFYELIQANGGRISVLDFAIAARLPGPQARAFLDARAREFYANFEPTEHGDVLYTFGASGVSSKTEVAVPQPADQAPPAPAAEKGAMSDRTFRPGAPAPRATSVLQLPLGELAGRLRCSLTLLDQKKWAADFARWSKERDPEGLSWSYDPLSNRFYCLP